MFSFSRWLYCNDIKNAIDFWMSDRAGDCTTFLKSLNVEDEKVLKCCAHMILCADHAIEKTFKQLEQKIGVHKLLDTSAGDRAFTGGSSVHTLGLIAISKLLSPSHASHTVSLYNEFKQWLENNNEDPAKFTAKLGDLIIFPLMYLYGIYRHTRHEGDDSKCDWFSVQ